MTTQKYINDTTSEHTRTHTHTQGFTPVHIDREKKNRDYFVHTEYMFIIYINTIISHSLFCVFSGKTKLTLNLTEMHSNNILSSLTNSLTHNTNSLEPPATNYSNLVGTFIQNTLQCLEGVYFYYGWPQWESVGIKPSLLAEILNSCTTAAGRITWFCA